MTEHHTNHTSHHTQSTFHVIVSHAQKTPSPIPMSINMYRGHISLTNRNWITNIIAAATITTSNTIQLKKGSKPKLTHETTKPICRGIRNVAALEETQKPNRSKADSIVTYPLPLTHFPITSILTRPKKVPAMNQTSALQPQDRSKIKTKKVLYAFRIDQTWCEW